MTSPSERYAGLVEALVNTSDANIDRSKKGFGSSGQLRIKGKIFVMLVRGRLVVKLPRQRVDRLIAAGQGQRFDPGRGRLMQEWFSLDPAAETDWLTLANEALNFVAR